MGESLSAQVVRLRAAVAQHKKAIRLHREYLARAAADLATLEHDCRRRGIDVIVVSAEDTTTGAGAIHGRPDTDSRSHH